MLTISKVNHWFPNDRPLTEKSKRVLYDVNLEINPTEFVAVVGPSGCGKSTLLKALVGTHPPCAGKVSHNGTPITKPCRDIGIVYQNYSLYDFKTAEQNVAFGLTLDQTSLPYRLCGGYRWSGLRKRHLEQAKEMLVRVGLERAIGHYPTELSGGMRQRVAIAQALIMKPKVLLLDEPFGALDEATREDLQKLLLQLYQDNLTKSDPMAIMIVTHELNEAFYVASRVVGLSQYHTEGKKGATICWDKSVPIFLPDDPRDFSVFYDQKEELRKVVFHEDMNNVAADHVEIKL